MNKPTVYVDPNNIIMVNSFVKKNNYNFVDDINSLPEKYSIQINIWEKLNDKRFCNANHQNEHEDLVFPEKIAHDIKQGNVHVVFNLSWESCYTLFGNYKKIIDFDEFCKLYDCPKSNITFLIANHNVTSSDMGVNTIVYNHPMLYTGTGDLTYDLTKSEDKIELIANKQLMPFNGLFYTRRAREERLAILYQLKQLQLLDKINYSCLVPPKNPTRLNSYFKKNNFPDLTTILQQIKIPTECMFSSITNHDPESCNDLINRIDWQHAYTSSFHIVIESYPDSPGFVTEKSIKPMRMLQPFVIYGSVGTIAYLKELGYDVFDDFIDHRYDTVDDNKLRMQMVVSEIQRLSVLSQEAWTNILYNRLDRLVSNFNKAVNSSRYYHTGDLKLYDACQRHNVDL